MSTTPWCKLIDRLFVVRLLLNADTLKCLVYYNNFPVWRKVCAHLTIRLVCAYWASRYSPLPFAAIIIPILLGRLSNRFRRTPMWLCAHSQSGTRSLVRSGSDAGWGGLVCSGYSSSSQWQMSMGLRSRLCAVHSSSSTAILANPCLHGARFGAGLGLLDPVKRSCNATAYNGILDNLEMGVMVRCSYTFGHIVYLIKCECVSGEHSMVLVVWCRRLSFEILTWFPESSTAPGKGLGRYGIVAPFGGDCRREEKRERFTLWITNFLGWPRLIGQNWIHGLKKKNLLTFSITPILLSKD